MSDEYTKVNKHMYALGLIAFVVLWLPYVHATGLEPMLWNPRPQDELLEVRGYLLPHKLIDCDGPYCAHVDYRLQLEDGKILHVNCEPAPVINTCLHSAEQSAFLHRKEDYKGKVVSGEAVLRLSVNERPFYFKIISNIYQFISRVQHNDAPEYVISSASINGNEILSYEKSVKNLRNTEILLFSDSGFQERSQRKMGSMIFWVITVPLTMFFLYVIYAGLTYSGKKNVY